MKVRGLADQTISEILPSRPQLPGCGIVNLSTEMYMSARRASNMNIMKYFSFTTNEQYHFTDFSLEQSMNRCFFVVLRLSTFTITE